VALKLYLDDCSNSDLLANLLRQAGHEVVRPTDERVGLIGEDDDVHFAFVAAHGLTLITKNPANFKALHDLDLPHSGILAVYQDNDPSRDMSNADIVKSHPKPGRGGTTGRSSDFWRVSHSQRLAILNTSARKTARDGNHENQQLLL